MDDTITGDQRLTPKAQDLKKVLEKLPAEEAKKVAVESTLDRALAAATNKYQQRLLKDYLEDGKSALSMLLAEAALRKLLQSEDEEIVLKAAKELRAAMKPAKGLTNNFSADKMQVNQQGSLPEDPRLKELKEDLG